MCKRFSLIIMLTALCGSILAVAERHGILVGVVLKLDSAAKVVVVKLADGTSHTLHFVKQTTVHGAQDTAVAGKDAFHGLKDNIGKDGLKATEAAVTHIDRGAKTLAVKTADGAEVTFRLTDSAAKSAGTDIKEGAEKSAKVTVYYTEEGGRKVAHFFKWAI
jgi:ABC-type oligopeptide transport system substrate-binding subunit